jgi:hypothetical protein
MRDSKAMLSFALPTLRRFLGAAPPAQENRNLIYRLRAWPDLAEAGRTAGVYQLLSVMSNRPVTRQWIAMRSRMEPRQVDALLRQLVAAGAVDVIDPARFTQVEP